MWPGFGVLGDQAQADSPGLGMTLLALFVLGVFFFGLGSMLRKTGKFFQALAKSNAEARAASRASAEGGDARAAAALDVGGLHFHGVGGTSGAGDDHHRGRAGNHDLDGTGAGDYDERGGRYVLDGTDLYHVAPGGRPVLISTGTVVARPNERGANNGARVVDGQLGARSVVGDEVGGLTDDVG